MRKHFYKSSISSDGSTSNNESSYNDQKLENAAELQEIEEEARVLRLPTRRRLVFGGCGSTCPNNNVTATDEDRCSNRKHAGAKRWNSFHSTRREYHPNRIKKERKSIAAIADSNLLHLQQPKTPGRNITPPTSLDDTFFLNPTNRMLIDKSNYMSSPSKSWILRRGKSLVDDNNKIIDTVAYIDENIDDLGG
jgi:hypothetical protein